MIGLAVLHYVHVVWAGGGIFYALAVVPTLIARGPAAAPLYGQLARRAAPLMGAAGGLVLLSGLLRLWAEPRIDSFGALWSGYGLAVLAALLLVFVAEGNGGPIRARLGRLAADPDAFSREAPALARRDAAVFVPAVLLILALMVAMRLGLV
ncbi:hypothetical protein OG2516_06262 [Oceanicola granulosus HTCC2516]|uniref:Copper resistance protein D domain-containing protein n=1 Tax=Oceanicola granulosus (strain ATCC BAA-861 / DSM 15982 / KCTC 12143 / HTCC2516) TaxID=314256 RepID=Q2CDB2_OCEGH|nr:hypothetical protein [Oceanicola granulosus]EAR50678.1 hypothetical protein OG2516_06262 [Oceanicola granulosus HTCC2516]